MAHRTEEEVLNKYEVEESKKEAFRGRGAQKQEIQIKKEERRLVGKNFSVFGEYNLQHLQCKEEESTEEEEEMKQQQRMVIMRGSVKVNLIKRKNGR